MNVYKKELQDGVGELVEKQVSIAYCSPVILSEENDLNPSYVNKVIANSANPKQIDLYYIKSILVSTGWNKNDDVFDSAVTWAARKTPEDKQFNFMHNENDIIGHITGSYVVDRDGATVADVETYTSDFDIVTEAVLYNSWTNQENRDRMNQLIAEIEEGKWFVSMECLFSGFDYAIMDESGSTTLLPRSEASAFLTKHLRAYGGTGQYEGRKIGRYLKDISFSGKGLVSKPANPRSVILDASRASSDNTITFKFNHSEGDTMTDNTVLEQNVTDLRAELASLKEENATLRASVEAFNSKEHEDVVSKLQAELTTKADSIESLNKSLSERDATISSLEEALAKSKEEMMSKEEELKMMKKEKSKMSRKASLLDLGFSEEETEESLASYEELDDTSFDLIVAAMKKVTMKKEKALKQEDSKKDAKMVEEKKDKKYAEEESKADEVTEELFTNVDSTEATLINASDEVDQLEATRASIAEWLETNVLRVK